jgi:hypothetical protein
MLAWETLPDNYDILITIGVDVDRTPQSIDTAILADDRAAPDNKPHIAESVRTSSLQHFPQL